MSIIWLLRVPPANCALHRAMVQCTLACLLWREGGLRVEIRRSGEMTPSEQRDVRDLARRVFGTDGAGYTWADVDWHDWYLTSRQAG